MNTKTLSNRALNVIDQYLHFKVGNAVCSVPYFNNKTVKARATLRVSSGKGSPKDIFDEVQTLFVKAHVAVGSISDESLKKILTDNNIGIDCSAYAYYILNAESEELGKGSIDKHISFINCHGLVGKIRCSLRPIENCDVSTLTNDKNSRAISIKEIVPGDIITMVGKSSADDTNDSIKSPQGLIFTEYDRDHILVIHQVEYQNFIPYKIHYSHAVAYPEDGVYGSGIKQGVIEITDINKSITEQAWIENEKQGDANRIFTRAKKSKTEVRRLKWLS